MEVNITNKFTSLWTDDWSQRFFVILPKIIISPILFQYAIILIVIWMSELLVGMLSYSYIQDVRSDLAQTLFESFQALYHVDAEFTQSVDLIQSKVRPNTILSNRFTSKGKANFHYASKENRI